MPQVPLLLRSLILRWTPDSPVTAKLGPLEELAILDTAHKLVPRDKVVLLAILLASPRATGGVRDGEAKLARVLVEELVEQGRLAGSTWSADDKGLESQSWNLCSSVSGASSRGG